MLAAAVREEFMDSENMKEVEVVGPSDILNTGIRH